MKLKHRHKWSYLVLLDHIKTLQAILSGITTMFAYRATYTKTWYIFPILGRTGHNSANFPKIGQTRLYLGILDI